MGPSRCSALLLCSKHGNRPWTTSIEHAWGALQQGEARTQQQGLVLRDDAVLDFAHEHRECMGQPSGQGAHCSRGKREPSSRLWCSAMTKSLFLSMSTSQA